MASVFWDAYGISFIDYFEEGKTNNNEYYMSLFVQLIAEIKKQRSHMEKKKLPFTMVKLDELRFEFSTHCTLQILPSEASDFL